MAFALVALTASACAEHQEASPSVDTVASAPTTAPVVPHGSSTTKPHPRGAAANVGFVESLVRNGQLTASSSVKTVRAEGDEIIVTTSLTDHEAATALWEALADALGCDDSFLLIRGWSVVLEDGSVVDEPGPHFARCVGT